MSMALLIMLEDMDLTSLIFARDFQKRRKNIVLFGARIIRNTLRNRRAR